MKVSDTTCGVRHRFNFGEQSFTCLGDDLARASLLEKRLTEARLDPADTSPDGGRIEVHRGPGAGELPGSCNCKHGLQVVPADCLHNCRCLLHTHRLPANHRALT